MRYSFTAVFPFTTTAGLLGSFAASANFAVEFFKKVHLNIMTKLVGQAKEISAIRGQVEAVAQDSF